MKRMPSIRRREALKGLAGIAAGAALPTAASAQGTALVIAQTSDVTTLDPAFSIDTSTGNVLKHIYQSILWRNPDMTIGPAVARRAERVSDTEWRVTLNTGGKFSNGEPVDAEAVRFSVARLNDPATKSPNRSLMAKLQTVRVDAPDALTFITDGPDALFEARLSNMLVVPPKHTQSASLADTPVGSGPYVLEQWRRNDAVVLKANPGYSGPALRFSSVTFRAVPEEIARISALRTGEVGLITSVSPNQADSLTRSGGVQVLRADSTRVMVVQFNSAMPPADDVRFRRAVAMAVNREEIVKGLMKGYATILPTVFAPAVQGVPRDAKGDFPYDPAQSKQLITELRLQGKEVEISGGAGHFPLDREIALAVGAELRRVGLVPKVRTEEYGTFLADVKKRTAASVFIQPHGNIWFDPMPQVIAFFASDGFISGWRDPDLDRLIASADSALGERRVKLVGDIITRLHDTAACAPLFAYQFIYAAAPSLHWKPRPDDVILAMEIT